MRAWDTGKDPSRVPSAPRQAFYTVPSARTPPALLRAERGRAYAKTSARARERTREDAHERCEAGQRERQTSLLPNSKAPTDRPAVGNANFAARVD